LGTHTFPLGGGAVVVVTPAPRVQTFLSTTGAGAVCGWYGEGAFPSLATGAAAGAGAEGATALRVYQTNISL